MRGKKAYSLLLLLFFLGFNEVSEATPTMVTQEADIQFIADDEQKPTPIDPGPNPPEEIEPGPNPVAPGALRFDYVPSFKFGGNNSIEARAQNYYSYFEQVTVIGSQVSHEGNSFLQVTDVRGGTLGWKINVSNDGVFKSTGAPDIKNTQMTLSNLSIKSLSGMDDSDKIPWLSPKEIVIGKDQGIQEIAKADGTKQQGYGIWHILFGDVAKRTSGQGFDGTGTTGVVDETKKDRNPAIKLHIPAGEIIHKEQLYTTTVVWELSDKL